MNNDQLELSRHCKICNNLDFDVSYGSRCSLTSQKPNFVNKCSEIEFGDNAKKYITEISVEKKLVEKSKFDYLGTFVIYLLISLFFIIGGILLSKYLFGFGVFHTVTLVLVGVGVIVLPKAFGALNMYNAKNNVASEKIKNLENTLNIYNKKYSIDLNINEIHGINEVKSNVKIY